MLSFHCLICYWLYSLSEPPKPTQPAAITRWCSASCLMKVRHPFVASFITTCCHAPFMTAVGPAPIYTTCGSARVR